MKSPKATETIIAGEVNKMPIYEYECTKCGHQTEEWQSFSDPPITQCELCKGKMRKLISQSTFHLKGTGWYVTDYASKGSRFQEKKAKSAEDATPKEAKSSTEKSTTETSSSSGKDKKDK